MGKHLPGIDGLRAFAVLSVVAYHAGLPLPAGFVGVDVFFVISGYVITRMLLAEPAIDLAAFYARRVRRILPALVLVVAVTLGLSAALLGPAARVEVTHSAMASMAMAGNVYFQFATGGYFDPVSDEMPLLHLWSLGVEEQFYLMWPLLLMVRKPWVLALLAVGSFVLWQTLSPEAAFYQMPARFWELAVGGLLAYLPRRHDVAVGIEGLPHHVGRVGPSDFRLVGQDAECLVEGPRWRDQPRSRIAAEEAGWLGRKPQIVDSEQLGEGAGALGGELAFGIAAAKYVSVRVSLDPLAEPAYINGHISRLARLLGSPILRKTARADVQPASHIATFAGWAGLLVLCLAITDGTLTAVVGSALVIYAIHSGARLRVLEMSGIRYIGLVSYSFYLWHWPLLAIAKASNFEPPSLAVNLGLCGLAFVLACLSYHLVEQPFRRTNAPKLRAIALGVTACVVTAGCAAAAMPQATDLGRKPVLARECYQTHQDAPALPPLSCGRGPVVLWGDSHAQTWQPYAESFGKVYQMTRTGCPPSAIPLSRKPVSVRRERVAGTLHRWEGCTKFNALALEEAKRGKVVILSVRWLGVYEDEARAGVSSALDALAEVPRVIVMGPVPVMPHDPALCVTKGRWCAMPRAEFDRQAEPIRAFLRDAMVKHPNAEWIDPTGYLCNATECPMAKDGVPLYFDDNHISAQAAQAFTRR